MEEVSSLRVSLGLDTAEFTRRIQDVNRSLRVIKSEFSAASDGTKAWANSLEGLQAKNQNLTRQIDVQRQKVEQLKRQYEEVAVAEGEDSRAAQNLLIQYNNATGVMRRMGTSLETTNRRINEQSSEFGQLQRRVNTSVESMDRELRVLESGFNEVSTSMGHMHGSAGQAGQGLDQLRTRHDQLNRSIDIQSRRLSELQNLLEATTREEGQNSQATQEMQIRYNQASQALNRTQSELHQTHAAIQTQSSAWGRLGQALGSGMSQLGMMGMNLQMTGMNMAMSFTPALMALGGGLAVTAKKAMDFESQMSSVKSVMSPQEVDQFSGSLEKLAVEMGQKTKYSSMEAAQGIEELIKAGVSVTDIMNGGLDGALSLATAGELELKDAAEIASTALNAFKKDNLSVADAADLLAGAANASATSVSEMKFGLSMASAVASGVGLSFKDTTEALAVFAQNGLKGSDAGTSLKTMLLNLVPTSNDASAAMVDLGLMTKEGASAFYDANGSIKSMADIAEILKTKLSGLTNEQRQLALKTMFGTDAVRAANILYNEGADGLNNMFSAMSKVKAADVAATKLDNMKGKIEILKGSLETAAISFGKTLMPAIDKVTASIKEATDWFNDLSPSIKKAIAIGGIAATAITGITVALGGTLMVVGGAISGFATISAAVAAFTGGAGILATTLTALAGPVGLVVAGVGLAAGAFFALKQETKASSEANLTHAKTLIGQQQSLESLIGQYEELRNKNNLSNYELLRFRDIQKELETAKSAEEIAKLKDEAEKLREKSGLSNEQLGTMLGLNDKIIEKSPAVGQAFSDQGNKIIKNTDDLHEANNKLRENIQLELRTQEIKAAAKLDDSIRTKINDVKELNGKIVELNNAEIEAAAKEYQLAQMKGQQINAYREGQDAIAKGMDMDIMRLQQEVSIQNNKVGSVATEVQEKQKSLDKTTESITKTQSLLDQMINIQLAQAGINAKGQEGIAQLDQAITKTVARKAELLRVQDQQGGLNAEQQKELDNLDGALEKYSAAKGSVTEIQSEQEAVNKKIDDGTSKAGSMSEVLSASEVKNIKFTGNGYTDAKIISDEANRGATKEINATDYGKTHSIDAEANKGASKTISIGASISSTFTKAVKAFEKMSGINIPGFATGTNFAPGGIALVGEEGPELMYVPRGAQVKTASQTNRILGGNTFQSVNGVNQNSPGNNKLIDSILSLASRPIRLIIDGREFAMATVDDITEIQDFKSNRTKFFNGG